MMKGCETRVVWAVAVGMTIAASGVTLEDAALRLGFAEADGNFAVTSAVNRLAGEIPFAEGRDGPGFWKAVFRRGDSDDWVTVDSDAPCRARRAERALAAEVTFIWEGLDLPGEPDTVDVRATVRLAQEGESRWALAVTNRSTVYGLAETTYPILRQVAASGTADVLLPRPDFGAWLARNYRGTKDRRYGCMSYHPMMTAFMKGEAGLYVAAHDSEARIKTMMIDRNCTVSFATPVENAGVPGKAAEGPRYEVTVAAFKGDWWQAARFYRAWALTTPWTAKGRILDRADYPRRLAEIPLWINTHAYPEEASNTMARAKAIFPNHEVGLHWHLWQHSGHDVNYPEYFPEQPGTRECLAFCHSIGTEAMPYTSGRLWSTNLVSFALVKGLALTRPNGEPYVEQYGKLTPPMSPMCPYTKAWDDVVNDFAGRVLGLGAGSIFLDQIGACPGQACYQSSHGHPVGGGTWYFEGYQRLLAKTHARYAAKGAFLTTEGSGEEWMNVIDGYLQITQRKPDDVPFFHAVYSGYTTYFCSPENHEDDLDSFWATQAREILWGQTLGWYHPQILEDAEKCALIRRLADFRQDHLDCLAYGTLEGELDFLDPVPTQPVTWLGRKEFFMWKVKDAPLSPTIVGELPGVVGYLWRSGTTGRRAAYIANLTARPQTVRAVLAGREKKFALMPRTLMVYDSEP